MIITIMTKITTNDKNNNKNNNKYLPEQQQQQPKKNKNKNKIKSLPYIQKYLSSKRTSPIKTQMLNILIIKLLDTFFNIKPK